MPLLTAERARELLDYDPDTGGFTWRVRVSKSIQSGAMAGCKRSDGYVYIGINGKYYLAHRLAWLIISGAWPIEHIDHLNGVGDDNRIANLREASRSLNQQNQRRPRADNTSGYLGVTWNSACESFIATIKIQGKRRHIGCFTDPAEAHAAYLDAKRRLHAGCTI